MMNSPFHGSYARSVREIPVQFVGSERKEIRSEKRSESTVKIQKVLRGFLVRKSMKKIANIRAEVEEIEKRMSKEEMVELIGRDSKETLRVNETLMSLLFKLDSVRGVDSRVRDCRKAVIKRAIALQERLDSVVCNNNRNNENVDGMAECTKIANDEVVQDCCPEESVGTSRTESQSGSSSTMDSQSLVEPCEEDEDDASSLKQEKNDVQRENMKEESVWNRELLLEKMMEDNEKMMDLMAQLFERNAMQTRLLSSLS